MVSANFQYWSPQAVGRARMWTMVWSMIFIESAKRCLGRTSALGSSLWIAARPYFKVISACPASSCCSREMELCSFSCALTVWAVSKRNFSRLASNSFVRSTTRSAKRSRACRKASFAFLRLVISRDTLNMEVISPLNRPSGEPAKCSTRQCQLGICWHSLQKLPDRFGKLAGCLFS